MKRLIHLLGSKLLLTANATILLGLLSNFAHGQVLINENFSSLAGHTPPTGWTNTDLTSSGTYWYFDNPGGQNITGGIPGFDNDFAILDSYEDCNTNEDATLESPSFDASIPGQYELDFDNQFNYYSLSGTPIVEVWNGATWNSVLTMNADDGYPNPASHKKINITAATGGSTMAKVRFHWTNGDCGDWWAVDNVTITHLNCMSPSTTFSVVPDCANSQFSVDVNVTSMGSATSLTIVEGSTTYGAPITTPGIVTAGPFVTGSSHTLTLVHNLNAQCNVVSPVQAYNNCPVTNDDCNTAVALTPSALATCNPVTANNVGATISSPTAPSCAFATDNDVWFSFTATNTTHKLLISNVMPVNTANEYNYLGAAVYDGSNSCSLASDIGCEQYIAANDGGLYTLPLTLTGLTVNNVYYVRVWASDYDIDPEVSFDICISTPPPPPANDDCNGAISLTPSALVTCNPIPASNESATVSSPTAPSCAFATDNDVWFSFTATDTAHIVNVTNIQPVNAANDYNAVGAAVYDGAGGCSLASDIGCESYIAEYDASSGQYLSPLVVTGLIVNNVYYVRVWVSDYDIDPEVSFDICVSTVPPPPANDDCSGALLLTLNAPVAYFDNSGGTDDVLPFPTCGGTSVGASRGLWFSFTAPYTGSFIFSGCDAPMDTYVRIYEGSCGSFTTCTGFDDDGCSTSLSPLLTFNGVANTIYYILVGNLDASEPIGSFPAQISTPLVIKLDQISATNTGASNRVDWNTLSEEQSDKFELERSADGKQFQKLTTIPAEGQPQHYSYMDNTPLHGYNYYRLYMKDIAGKGVYSETVKAFVKGAGFEIDVYPNPTSQDITVRVSGIGQIKATIQITDVTGKVLRTAIMNDSEENINMHGLSQGIYLIKYSDASHSQTIRVHKQ